MRRSTPSLIRFRFRCPCGGTTAGRVSRTEHALRLFEVFRGVHSVPGCAPSDAIGIFDHWQMVDAPSAPAAR